MTVKLSKKDKDLLSRISYWEAGIDGKKAGQAVVDVVLNRVASPDFPNTVKGVLSQRNQFEPVRKYGGVDKLPAVSKKWASDMTSYANGVLKGTVPRVAGKAMFFQNQSVTKKRNTKFAQKNAVKVGRQVFSSDYNGTVPRFGDLPGYKPTSLPESLASLPRNRSVPASLTLADAMADKAAMTTPSMRTPMSGPRDQIPDYMKDMPVKVAGRTNTRLGDITSSFKGLHNMGQQAFAGGPNNPETLKATAIMRDALGSNFNRLTAQRDTFHDKYRPNSRHNLGTKSDFTLRDYQAGIKTAKAALEAKGLVSGKDFKLNHEGIGFRGSTAPHMDFELTKSGQQKIAALDYDPSPVQMASLPQSKPEPRGMSVMEGLRQLEQQGLPAYAPEIDASAGIAAIDGLMDLSSVPSLSGANTMPVERRPISDITPNSPMWNAMGAEAEPMWNARGAEVEEGPMWNAMGAEADVQEFVPKSVKTASYSPDGSLKLSKDDFKSRLEFDPDIVGSGVVGTAHAMKTANLPTADAIGSYDFASMAPSERVEQSFLDVREPTHFKERYLQQDLASKSYPRLAQHRVEQAFGVMDDLPSMPTAPQAAETLDTASIQAPARANTGIQPLSLLDLSSLNAPTLGPVDPNLTAPQTPVAPTVQAPQVTPVSQPITQPVMSLPKAQPGAPGSILPLGARPGAVNPAAIKAAQRMTRGLTTGVGGLLGGPLGALAGNLAGRGLNDRVGRAASDFLSGGLVGASGHTYASGSNIGNGLSAWNKSGNAGDFWDHNDDLDNIAQQAWDRERAASGQTNRMSLGDVLSRDFGGMFSSSDRKSGGSGSGGVSWW